MRILTSILALLLLAQSTLGQSVIIFRKAPAPAGSSLALVATCSSSETGTTNPSTCTWSSTVPTGANIYCASQSETGGADDYTFTDSGSNTYTNPPASLQDTSGSGGTFVQFGQSANLGSSVTTTTVTSSGTPTRLVLMCYAVTGGNASPVDGSLGFNRTTGTSVSTTVSPSASASVLFLFAWVENSSGTITPGTGFTTEITVGPSPSFYKMALLSKISSTSGSNTCDFSYSTSSLIYVSCQAYK